MCDSGWADIANDLIFHLAERVVGVATFIRLSAVCKAWHWVASSTECCSPVPWLMLGEKEGSEFRDFYDHSTGELYQLYLPQAQGCRNLGSAHGWLVTANASEGNHFHLLNPLTGTQITLPCTNTFPSEVFRNCLGSPEGIRDCFVIKATCSSMESDEGYIVFEIHKGGNNYRLSYCRSNDEEWTTFDYLGAKGIGFVGGVFFMMSWYGEILRIDFASKRLLKIVNLPKYGYYHTQDSQCYFVECAGEIFLLDKRFASSEIEMRTEEFKVYKIHVEAKKLVKVKSIGDYAFFVGKNNSVCLPITPTMKGFKRNSIYFTDDRNGLPGCLKENEFGWDMGVFSLEDGSITPHYRGSVTKSVVSMPIWVMVNPH